MKDKTLTKEDVKSKFLGGYSFSPNGGVVDCVNLSTITKENSGMIAGHLAAMINRETSEALVEYINILIDEASEKIISEGYKQYVHHS